MNLLGPKQHDLEMGTVIRRPRNSMCKSTIFKSHPDGRWTFQYLYLEI